MGAKEAAVMVKQGMTVAEARVVFNEWMAAFDGAEKKLKGFKNAAKERAGQIAMAFEKWPSPYNPAEMRKMVEDFGWWFRKQEACFERPRNSLEKSLAEMGRLAQEWDGEGMWWEIYFRAPEESKLKWLAAEHLPKEIDALMEKKQKRGKKK